MSQDIIVRLRSPAGVSRITLPPTATLGDLQEKVTASTGVAAGSQKLARDNKGSQLIAGTPAATLASLNVKRGDEIHLLNNDATIAEQVLTKVPIPVEPEKPVAASAAAAGSSSSAQNSTTKETEAAKPIVPTAPAGFGTKKMDIHGLDKVDKNAPFAVFDTFIRNFRYDTTSLAGTQVYKTVPLKAGGMIKIPPAVSIKQQPYRHVDQISFYNNTEVQNFIGYWSRDLEMMTQRIGWMYGYYLADHNYGDKEHCEGTRAVVEGIYEPPQEMAGGDVVMQHDPDFPTVNRVAEALGLELIGLIFTSMPLDDDLVISPAEAQRSARLQHEYSTDCHFTKYRLSKFVSCAVRPDYSQGGNPSLQPFMVSDQCTAMVRDTVFCEDPDPKCCVVREAAKDVLIPDFLVEGKANKKVPTDFFVVRMVDSQPKVIHSIFKHGDFPRENRPRALQQREDLKKYLKKRSSSEASWSRFADFHLLLFIAKAFDVDTALPLCECIRDRKEISPDMKSFFESVCS
jgi:nuclear protein localization family protein 4